MAFLDLDLCDASIFDADDRELAKAVSASPKRIRTLAINKVPNVFPITDPSAERTALARFVASRPDFQKRAGQALANRFADREESVHVEKKIYGGFYSSADEHVLEDFKSSDWCRRAELVGQLEDSRLKQLGMRLIFWNAQEFSSAGYQSSAQIAIRDRWLSNEPGAPWTNKAAVEQQLDEIECAEALDRDRISALQEFYRRRISQVGKVYSRPS